MIKIRPETIYTKTIDKIFDKLKAADGEIEKCKIHYDKQAENSPLTNREIKNLAYLKTFRKKLLALNNEIYHSEA